MALTKIATKNASAKIKSIIDPVELEPAVGIEEKIEEDTVITPPVDEEDAGGDEVSLDAEDLNPFGDRWEE